MVPRHSPLPPAPAAPLRAGRPAYLTRQILARVDACKLERDRLAVHASGISNGVLGASFGGEKAGAKIRNGALLPSLYETILLYPLDVALKLTRDAWRERLRRESVNDNGREAWAARCGVSAMHFDAPIALLLDKPEQR